jgi:N-ethylmaleimide reductase
VTAAVHACGGRIFAQLWFIGRVSHPVFLKGETPWAPSAIRPQQHVHTAAGETLDCVTPQEMSTENIVQAISDFADAARYAVEAGFDGVQIHAANGYLIDQFLRDGTNHRRDRYGGSIKHRLRFLMEVVEACVDAVGGHRVAVRLSPLNAYNDMADSDPAALFTAAASALSALPLSFLEIVEGLPDHFLYAPGGPILPHVREAFDGVLVANAGYQLTTASEALATGAADAVAFGVPFIANPDLVHRLRQGLPLSPADPDTFYTPGEPGYLDYPTYAERPVEGDAYQDLSLDEARKH